MLTKHHDNLPKYKGKPARFKNVIKSYIELKEGNLNPPIDAKDCRKIFDEITSDGISKDDYPDGKFFRKGVTYVYVTNQISSQGEINYFVDEFLRIVEIGQKDILESLVQKSDLLNSIIEKINEDESLANEDERIIMSIMAQELHFNPSKEGVGVNDLKSVFSHTNDTIRIKLKKVHERGLIEKIKSRPVRYVISNDYLEN